MVDYIKQIHRLNGISVDYEKQLKDMFREIVRHVAGHENFHGIYFEVLGMRGVFEIRCYCGKLWEVKSYDISRSNMEVREVSDFIRKLNEPAFFKGLQKMKDDGKFEKQKRDDLLKVTESPTISSLEI